MQQIDTILVGGIEAEEFSLNAESVTQLVETIVQQWHKSAFLQVKMAYKPWAELGIKSYNDFDRSLESQRPLSDAMRQYFLQYDHHAKFLLYVTIQSQRNKQMESTVGYSNTQTIVVVYRIWDLAQGEILLDVNVEGFSYKFNEKHVSNQSSLGKNLAEDLAYYFFYDGMPESMSLTGLIDKTTWLFVQRLEKMKAGDK